MGNAIIINNLILKKSTFNFLKLIFLYLKFDLNQIHLALKKVK